MQLFLKLNSLFRLFTFIKWHVLLTKRLDVAQLIPPKNIKEIRQFLGIAGYHRNHINHYADITLILTRHLCKEKHQSTFSELTSALKKPLILTYPDRDKPYFLFMYISKYCWGTTLCQYTSKQDSMDVLKSITLILGKFSDTQCYYAVLTIEAFAI